MELLLELLNKKRIWIGAALILAILLTVVLVIIFWPLPKEAAQAPTTAATESPHATQPPAYQPEANAFGPEDFVLKDGFMTCLTGNALLGIDVSSHQGNIDWEQVKQAGIEFVFIRVGGRGYGKSGTLYTDDYAQINYKGAKAAGLKVGAYFFSQATNAKEARNEAYFALDQVKDWELDLPIAFDWEYIGKDARTANVDSRTLTDCVVAFCDIVEKEGYNAMLYTNPNYAGVGLQLEDLEGIDIWLALYSEEMTYPYRIAAWQYTDKGEIPGIDTIVDINLFFHETQA